ncbi:MAG: asparagine synthetase B [Parachlamydia sp.]|nr:asparagine synthetase B [Parachlamydia sp.]
MQGFAGIIYPDVFQSKPLIHPMLEALSYRGKGEKEHYTYKNIQIGICGKKLGTTPKKNLLVALDGSLDNTEGLRRELHQLGPLAPDLRDEELIAHSYAAWGTACVERFEGDFAFALLDQNQESLFLARDRVGKKPIYWTYAPHHFFFASELKALLATGCVPQTPALDAFACYLNFGYIPQDVSPIQEVNRLLPGHFLLLKRQRNLLISPYWSYSACFQRQQNLPPNEILHRLDELLAASCRTQTSGAKGDLGCVLGGGLGSSSVAAYLKDQAQERPLHAFSVGFQGENETDIEAAKTVSQKLNISITEDRISPQNVLDELVSIAWHLDEPLADFNSIAAWRLAKQAASQVSTLFSGMGSDELLAGHSRYIFEPVAQPWKEKSLQTIRQLLIPLLHALRLNKAYDLLRQSRVDPWQFGYLKQNALFSREDLAAASPKLAPLFDSQVFLAKFHHLSRISKPVSAFLYFDVKTLLPDNYMLLFERLSAAHHLEWKTPFLSRELLEFTASLPAIERLAEEETGRWLKPLLKGKIPDDVINRSKERRPDFLKRWATSPEISEVLHLLPRGALAESGLVSGSWIAKQLQSSESTQRHFRHLWAILMLEIWFRLYIEGPIQTNPPQISVKELLS